MPFSPKLGLISAVLGAGLLLAGCQTTGPKASATTAPTEQAAYCPKCETTFVKKRLRGEKGRVIGYSRREKMVCPDCKSAAANLFETGRYEHTCTTCGGTLEHCKVH